MLVKKDIKKCKKKRRKIIRAERGFQDAAEDKGVTFAAGAFN